MVFSDPEVVEILSTRFVPLALDDWYHRRRKDAEGEFLRKVIAQEQTRTDMTRSTQGRYVFTAGGRLFSFDNHATEGLERLKANLHDALRRFSASDDPAPAARAQDPAYDRTMPPGTVVVDVTMKILGGYKEGQEESLRQFQGILGRERLWIRKDEAEALAQGRFPESLKRRIVLAHLYDNTRGQHNAWWKEEEVRKLDLALSGGRLSGTVELKSGTDRRACRVDVLGFIESKDGRLSRFDVVLKGEFSEDPARPDLPDTEATFPLAMSFRLADPRDPGHRVAPACARNFEAYLR